MYVYKMEKHNDGRKKREKVRKLEKGNKRFVKCDETKKLKAEVR